MPGLGSRRFGRRLSDPLDRPADPGTRAVRGRLAGVSVRASIAAGAWVGFALGLVVGAVVGALLVWFAGAVQDWQRDLAFTFGVARRLLPLGDQVALLHEIETRWWLVIPGVSLGVGAFAAIVGGLVGGLLAGAYNRSPRHALVIVELPSGVVYPVAGKAVDHPAERAASERPEGVAGEAPVDRPGPSRPTPERPPEPG